MAIHGCQNSSPNWPITIKKAHKLLWLRHGTGWRARRKWPVAPPMKRRLQTAGGIYPSASLMTTKLVPHTATHGQREQKVAQRRLGATGGAFGALDS